MRIGLSLAILLLLLLWGVLLACSNSAKIVVEDAWTRPAVADGAGAVYMSIRNDGQLQDRLWKVETLIAEVVELHQTSIENGIMSMAMLPALDIPEGQQVTLEPASYHLMMVNLKQDLVSGDTFPIVLHFEESGEVGVRVVVQ